MSSGGWGSSYTPTNYGSSLADQLTGAANYDPTQQQSTSNQTSAARTFGSQDGGTTAASFLQPVAGSLQQGAAQAAGTTTPMNWLQPFAGNLNANTPAPSAAASNWAAMSGAMQNVGQAPVASAAAPQAQNAMQYSYAPMMRAGVAVTTPAQAAGAGTAYTYRGGINGNTNTAGNAQQNGLNSQTYTGPQYVVENGPGGGGDLYYKWNPQTNSYEQIANTQANMGAGSLLLGVTDPGLANATRIPTQNVAQSSSGMDGTALSEAGVNQYFNQQIQGYRTAGSTAAANTAAAQNAASAQGQADFLYNVMSGNGGQLPANLTGYSTDAVAAAQQQFQADQATKYKLQMTAPDTSAVDATNAASQASLNSMYASSGGGADGAYLSRQGSGNAATLTGQAKLAHDTDYADKFDVNLSTFAQALSNQSTADVNVTGQRLNQDIQSVGDTVNQLQQQLSQLDQATQLKVGNQLNNLQALIQQYQQAVLSYGQTSQQVIDLGRTILGAGAAALAGPVGAAATAAATAKA